MRSIVGLFVILVILIIIPSIDYAFGQEEPGKYLDRRALIWNLFFRMMVVAFTIGAVVSGTLFWLCWRFRESNPKAVQTKYEKAGEW